MLDEAHKALDDSIEPNGRLSIGANQTVSTLNLPHILAQYHKTYPKVDLSLLTTQTDELINKVLHFQLDGAFIKSSVNDENIVKELVSEENLVLITSPADHDIKAIYSKPFLMSPVGCPNRAQLESWLKSNSINNLRFMEFNNLDTIIEGVIAGLGASFVPQSAIVEHERVGLLRSFSIPKQYSSTKTFLIRHKDVLMTSALTKFIEMVETSTPYHPILSTEALNV